MTKRDMLQRRLGAIDEKIKTAQHWGALLTALDEERKAILRQLDDEQIR